MLRFPALVMALVLQVALPSMAEAAENYAQFGRQTLALPSPPSHCWVKDQHRVDAQSFEYHKSVQRGVGNKLLGYWADCRSLKEARAGVSNWLQSSWVIAAAPLTNGREVAFGHVDRTRYLGSMKENLSKQEMSQIFKDGKQKVDDAFTSANEQYLSNPDAVRIGKPLMLGILSVDTAIHIGMILKISDTSSERTVGMVGATTLVKGVSLWVYHYREYEGQKTIKALLAKSKAYMSRLDKRNP